ncbi:MAG: hypothetical protein UX98_C0009G0028 [Parcubacteria group bacterium GW2011_GWA2_47_26]|nr:MAG: hypothetical protein UX98_C0009G0028 [Parcubacteria group bacterium GW2011_GWA2_47_26]
MNSWGLQQFPKTTSGKIPRRYGSLPFLWGNFPRRVSLSSIFPLRGLLFHSQPFLIATRLSLGIALHQGLALNLNTFFAILIMGLLPNTILAAIPKIRLNFPKNSSAYIPYKPQNLSEKFISNFVNFASKAHSATVP